jgi:hypothetical protein
LDDGKMSSLGKSKIAYRHGRLEEWKEGKIDERR